MGLPRVRKTVRPQVSKKKTRRTTIGQGVTAVERVRRANNKCWCALLRLALTHAPEEARKTLREINKNDRKIARLMRKLSEE